MEDNPEHPFARYEDPMMFQPKEDVDDYQA